MKVNNDSPAFQFYPKDWLSSVRVRQLGAVGRGCYINLLSQLWFQLQRDGGLPTDDIALMRAAEATPEEWNICSTAVRNMFIERSGVLTQDRLEKEWKKQCAKRKNHVRAGIASGKSRRLKGLGAEQTLNKRSTNVEQTHEQNANKNEHSILHTPSSSLNNRASRGNLEKAGPQEPLDYDAMLAQRNRARVARVRDWLHKRFPKNPNDSSVRLEALKKGGMVRLAKLFIPYMPMDMLTDAALNAHIPADMQKADDPAAVAEYIRKTLDRINMENEQSWVDAEQGKQLVMGGL